MSPRFRAIERSPLGGAQGIFVALLAGGIVLRLTCLGRESLWSDEMLSIWVARMPLHAIIYGDVFDNFTPPLYYVMLHFWSRLIPLSEYGLRLFSALIDCANIVLFLFLCRRYLEKAAVVLVVAAYALAPFMIYYSQEGRMLTLAVFWALAHALSLDQAIRRKTGSVAWIWASVSGTCLALGMYTHYYLAFFGVGTLTLALYDARRSLVRCAVVGFAAVVAALIFLPWVPVAWEIARTGSQSFRKYFYEMIPYALFRFTVGYAVFPINASTKANFHGEIVAHLPVLIVVFGSLFFLVYRVARCQDKTSKGFFISTIWITFVPWAIAFLLSLVRAPMLSERYLTPTFPFFLMFLLGSTPRRTIADRAAIIAFFLLLVFGNWAYFGNPDFGKAQWREVAQYVSKEAKSGDVVMVEPFYKASLFRYYFGGSSPVLRTPRKPPGARSDGSSNYVAAVLSETDRIILISSGIPPGEGYAQELSKSATIEKSKFFPKETGILCSIWKRSH